MSNSDGKWFISSDGEVVKIHSLKLCIVVEYLSEERGACREEVHISGYSAALGTLNPLVFFSKQEEAEVESAQQADEISSLKRSLRLCQDSLPLRRANIRGEK